MISTLEILNNPQLIQAQFKERKRIRLLLTLRLIEDILKPRYKYNNIQWLGNWMFDEKS